MTGRIVFPSQDGEERPWRWSARLPVCLLCQRRV